MHHWEAYARIVWSLLAMANPLGVMPFFIGFYQLSHH